MSIHGYKRRREERKQRIFFQQKFVVLLLAILLFCSISYFIQREERYRSIITQMADYNVVQSIMGGSMELGVTSEGQATVLFCDIRGFTGIMESMEPGEALDFINKHMTELSQNVGARGGVIDKFNGDRIMTVFNRTHTEEEDATQAIFCAIDMVKIRNHLNEISGIPAKVGLGIASGKVVTGYLGSPDHKHYTVMGRCVNVAAVLCNIAGADEILMDSETRDLIGKRANTRRVNDLIIEGLHPIPVYQLIGLTADTST
jgi:adenylate cyclase